MSTDPEEAQTQTNSLYTLLSEEITDDSQEQTEQPEFDDASY
jgi:hypothetical protein